jgi:hypothetical protein
MRLRLKNRSTFEKKSEGLLNFARSYLSEAFPNPDREGCPSEATLRSLAFNPRESEPNVTEHLAACSPCFRRYGELLAELRSQRVAGRRFSWARAFTWTNTHPIVARAGALCVLLIAIGSGLLFLATKLQKAPSVEIRRAPTLVEPVNPTTAYVPFGLDLTALSLVRGAGSSGIVPQRLAVPSSPLDLTITLPLASKEGPYDLKLTAGGRTVWSKSAEAHLREGKTRIRVEADFRQIPAGIYELEVRSSAGIRLMQPVLIGPVLPENGKQE